MGDKSLLYSGMHTPTHFCGYHVIDYCDEMGQNSPECDDCKDGFYTVTGLKCHTCGISKCNECTPLVLGSD